MPTTVRSGPSPMSLQSRKQDAAGELTGNHSLIGDIIDILIRETAGNQTVTDYDPRHLPSNAHYRAGENQYDYFTDKGGRIVRAHADELRPKPPRKRLDHDSKSWDKQPLDDAGHIFADQFGGSPELDNILSQARQVNQHGAWKQLENDWSAALAGGNRIHDVEVAMEYADETTRRPSRYHVRYSETTPDGDTFTHTPEPIDNHNPAGYGGSSHRGAHAPRRRH